MEKKVGAETAITFTKDVITISPDAMIIEAAKTMKDNDIGAIVVMSGGKMCGIVSERDIVRRAIMGGMDLNTTKVSSIMTKDVVSAQYNEGIEKMSTMMCKAHFRHMPILKGDQLVGIMSNRDLLEIMNKMC